MALLRQAIAVLAFTTLPVFAEDSTTPVRVGVMAPLTGPAASSGRWIQQGIDLAKAELKASGLPEPIIEIQDDMCTSQGGMNAYQALRAHDIKLIIGPVCNAAAVPILVPAQRDGVTLITTGIPSQAVQDGGPAVFTILAPIRSVAATITEFASKQGKSHFAVLYTPDEFGEENFRALSAAASSLGAQIVHAEQFVPGSLDFKPFILKSKEKQADAYLIAAYVGQYAAFLKQTAQLGSGLPLFAVPTFQSAELAALQPPPEFKMFYSYPGAGVDEKVEALRQQYLKLHPEEGSAVPMHVGSGRDALLLLAKALHDCASTESACIRSKLGLTAGFSGMNGTITLDQAGNNEQSATVEIRELSNGRYGSPAANH